MNLLSLVPKLHQFDDCASFFAAFPLQESDLLITSQRCHRQHLQPYTGAAQLLFLDRFGRGEPSDTMVDAAYASLARYDYQRVIAIGGGTVLDVAKLFALDNPAPAQALFDHSAAPLRSRELILVPTTCGTGSEVTNISILSLDALGTKLGLAADELYANDAVLIPALLHDLPLPIFAASSIDAFIHAIESYLSPKATRMTRLLSKQAMEMILSGYQALIGADTQARNEHMEDFLFASLYAGIAFGNAGTGAVHAMSYPFGAARHVAHGESNYALFSAVFEAYCRLKPEGEIKTLNAWLAARLDCAQEEVFRALDALFGAFLQKKPLRDYGVTQEDLHSYTENVMTKQGRLMANNYTELDRQCVYEIYERCY